LEGKALIIAIITESLRTGITTLFGLTMILVPIMIMIEYAARYKLLEKVSTLLGWLPRSLNLSPQASFPLIVGLFIGIFYGAAIFLEYSRQGLLNKRDMALCGVFLAFNHSIIEDNLVMGALGANIFILFPLRFVLAFVVTKAVAWYLDRKAVSTDAARGLKPAE
jgi:hypothetical protein